MAVRSGRRMPRAAARSFLSGCPRSPITILKPSRLRGPQKGLPMKIVLPSDVTFHPGPRLMIYRPRGILTEDKVATIVEFLEQAENKAVRPFNRFTDLSKLDALDLDFKTMIRVSLHRRLFY